MSSDDQLPPRRGTYRLGVFGSMMNPPHLGHLALVDAAREACALDRVVVVPAGVPPHRREPRVSARDRLTMAVRAFADLDHVVVSDTEVERGEHGEAGYMIDTVEELLELPETLGYDDLVVEPFLIVGADQVVNLPRWHRWEDLRELVHLAVVRRPDQIADRDLDATIAQLTRESDIDVHLANMHALPISSTLVREIAQGGDRGALVELLPPAILDDVLRLYGASVASH